jgi:hypothetical protein
MDESSVSAILGPCPLLRRRRLRAVLPDVTSAACRPSRGGPLPSDAFPVGLLSWGCPKIAPPSTSASRVHSRLPPPRERSSGRHRPWIATSRTRSVLAVPPGFDGLLHALPCRSVAPCCRPWGSSRFRLDAVVLSRATHHPHPRQGARSARQVHASLAVLPRCCHHGGRHDRHAFAPTATARRPPGRIQAPVVRLRRGPPSERVRGRPVARPPSACRGWLALGAGIVSQRLAFPRDATPFGAFSSPTAAPRHRGPCPLAVNPRARRDRQRHRWPSTDTPQVPTSGPCSIDELVVARRVATSRNPMLPWACVNLMGITRRCFRGPKSAFPCRSGGELTLIWITGEPVARDERTVGVVDRSKSVAPRHR